MVDGEIQIKNHIIILYILEQRYVMNGPGIQNKKQKLFCCLLFQWKRFIHNCPYGTFFERQLAYEILFFKDWSYLPGED